MKAQAVAIFAAVLIVLATLVIETDGFQPQIAVPKRESKDEVWASQLRDYIWLFLPK